MLERCRICFQRLQTTHRLALTGTKYVRTRFARSFLMIIAAAKLDVLRLLVSLGVLVPVYT